MAGIQRDPTCQAKPLHTILKATRGGILVGLLALTMAAFACAPAKSATDEWGTVAIQPGEPIKLGFAAALSGEYAKLGTDVQNAVQMALDDKATVHGFTLALQATDDKCEAGPAAAAAKKLVAEPGLVGVVGHMCPSGAARASEIYGEARMVMLSPSSTAGDLPVPTYPIFFRISWNDLAQAKGAAEFAVKTLKAKNVAIVYDKSGYGRSLAEEFKKDAEAAKLRTVAYEALPSRGEPPVRTEGAAGAIAAKIAAAGADLVYYGGLPAEGAALLVELRNVGVGAPFIGGDALYDVERFAVAAGGAAEGAYVTYARTGEGAKYADWKRRYEARFGPVGAFSPHGYDAAMVLLAAVEKAASKQSDGSLAIGRKALAEAVQDINYDGVTGKIAFDSKGDRTGTVVVVSRVVNGKFEEVK